MFHQEILGGGPEHSGVLWRLECGNAVVEGIRFATPDVKFVPDCEHLGSLWSPPLRARLVYSIEAPP